MMPTAVRAILSEAHGFADPAGHFTVQEIFDDPWCELHPSGFAMSDRFCVIRVCPPLIAETCSFLSDIDAEEYVSCVAEWLWGSTVSAITGLSRSTAVLDFTDKYPEVSIVLSSVAEHHGYPLDEWLAGKEAA